MLQFLTEVTHSQMTDHYSAPYLGDLIGAFPRLPIVGTCGGVEIDQVCQCFPRFPSYHLSETAPFFCEGFPSLLSSNR